MNAYESLEADARHAIEAEQAHAEALKSEITRLRNALTGVVWMHDEQMFVCGSDDAALVEERLEQARKVLKGATP